VIRSEALRERLSHDRSLLLVVVGTALLATVMRVYALGRRVLYYDEAWLGYWVLKYVDSGVWEYRPIVHGPFFARVNSGVFWLFGANEVTARLVVAVVGGCLPLAAYLFRERLRDSEVVVLALLLAANPLLVYYSRFMRNDVLLAAFALFALGFAVRALDTGRNRYVYAGAVSLGLAFTTKESALLYVVTALGAGLLVFDDRILRRGEGIRTAVAGGVRELRRGVTARAGHLAGAWLLFVAVVVYFYAPRPELWNALTNPTRLPGVAERATTGSLAAAVDHWVMGSKQGHPYLPYLIDTAKTLAGGAPSLTALSVGGFLFDRYGGERRDLVAFSFYCGVAAVLGYPLANNFPVPWSTVHAVVPLAVPAAVGGAAVYRWGRGRVAAVDADEVRIPWKRGRAAVAAAVLVVAAVNAGLVVAETSYRNPHESPRGGDGHEIVYYAQAPDNLSAVTGAIDRAASDAGNGTDVLFVDDPLAGDEAEMDDHETGAWYARMPLPWYTEAAGADVESVRGAWAMEGATPPVVITTVDAHDRVERRLSGNYTATYHPLDDVADRVVVVFRAEGVAPDAT
jgi:uncharacterized protein (TIGR03663 family)